MWIPLFGVDFVHTNARSRVIRLVELIGRSIDILIIWMKYATLVYFVIDGCKFRHGVAHGCTIVGLLCLELVLML